MKKRKIYLLCAIFVILTFAVSGCKVASQEFEHPSNYQQLAGLIGETMSDVCNELDVIQEDLENPAVGLYMLPEKIEYFGHSFEIFLTFDVTTEEKTLYGFWYRAVFTDDVKQAATLTSDLAETFTNKYESWNLYGVSHHITEQKDLVEFLGTDEIRTVSEALDLSKEVTDNMKEYMSEYKEKNDKTLEYGLILSATSIEDSQVTVTLEYEMNVNPNQ